MTDAKDTSILGVREAPEGYESIDWQHLTVEDLEGATVYDRHDREVATISDVVVSDEGTAQTVVMDVGGFFGIGSRTVGIAVDRLGVQKSARDGEVRVYLSMTDEEVRNLPAYGGPKYPPVNTGYPR